MIHQPTNLYGDYELGRNTSVGCFCDIGGKVGKNCKIQTMVSIPPLTVVGDGVFLGPGVRIINDKKMDGNLRGITIGKGAKIGIGAIICANVGKNAIVGAGAVVIEEVAEGTTVIGNPARIIK